MTDEELKEYEVTIHQKRKESIDFMKAFLQDLEDMYKRQLEMSKEVMKKGFKK
jgi:hypothetical protein